MAKKKEVEIEMVKGPSRDEEKYWRAEDALRTLTRAEEIRSDPDLMKDVAKCRDDKMRDLAKIKVETSMRTIKAPK